MASIHFGFATRLRKTRLASSDSVLVFTLEGSAESPINAFGSRPRRARPRGPPPALRRRRPRLCPRRVGGVRYRRLRVAAGEGADGGDHAAVVLEVVVRVEEVVLAVVHVLDRDPRPPEVVLHRPPRLDAVEPLAVSVAAPAAAATAPLPLTPPVRRARDPPPPAAPAPSALPAP